jgi:hypothetical protein
MKEEVVTIVQLTCMFAHEPDGVSSTGKNQNSVVIMVFVAILLYINALHECIKVHICQRIKYVRPH